MTKLKQRDIEANLELIESDLNSYYVLLNSLNGLYGRLATANILYDIFNKGITPMDIEKKASTVSWHRAGLANMRKALREKEIAIQLLEK
ncbi:hypothetical protein J4230_03900 [Candidatus Woesearchaeota archaeon]|nr:hypothetical protein [Candidatus Woesearchaeota archaeon]